MKNKSNLDVLFIHPENYFSAIYYIKLPSLELCSMSAVLNESGYSNKLIDFSAVNYEEEDICRTINELNPRIIIVYGTDMNHINMLSIVKKIKKEFPLIPVGVNGMIVTFIAEKILRDTNVDFVIRGFNDYAIKRILDIKIDKTRFNEVPGISYLVNDEFIETEYKEENLNELPVSNRNLYDLALYRKINQETIVRSSRGCPSRCDFCNKNVYSKFKIMDMENFFKEIDVLLEAEFNQFFFSDDTFAFSEIRLDQFREFYLKGKYTFKWTSNLRVIDIEESRIRKMKECGAYRVFIGIETVNGDANLLVNKKQNILNDLYNRIQILKDNNMEFHASFIVGCPGDRKKDLDNTIELVKRIKPTLVSFNQIKVYPGTKIFDHPERYGIITEDKYWFENPRWVSEPLIWTENLGKEEILEYTRKMMFEYINIDNEGDTVNV